MRSAPTSALVSCASCLETRTVAVPGEGAPNAEILFIGEGPGFHEDQQGRPFVGAAGQLLAEMLELIDLRREDVFITNVVRCRPPGNRDPMPDELQACDTYTQRQVAVLDPKLIVTLGRYSMARFIGQGPMRELHGRTREWNGIMCLAMYHPAAILRTPTVEMRRIYADDFRKIPALLAENAREGPTASPTPRGLASRQPAGGPGRPAPSVLTVSPLTAPERDSAWPPARFLPQDGTPRRKRVAICMADVLLAAPSCCRDRVPALPEGRIWGAGARGAGRAASARPRSCCRGRDLFVGGAGAARWRPPEPGALRAGAWLDSACWLLGAAGAERALARWEPATGLAWCGEWLDAARPGRACSAPR